MNVENYNLNNKYMFDVEHNENYNNKAELSFFTNINTQQLINNPNKYLHYDSFVSITYRSIRLMIFFQIYWNSEYTHLIKIEKIFLKLWNDKI